MDLLMPEMDEYVLILKMQSQSISWWRSDRWWISGRCIRFHQTFDLQTWMREQTWQAKANVVKSQG